MQILSESLHNSVKTGVLAAKTDWPLIYILLTLTTTVMCTLLIVYRIVRFAHRLLFFRSIISALIESSAMYTLALIVFLVVQRRNMMTADYADTILAYILVKRYLYSFLFNNWLFFIVWQAIAPTLLILRVAATPDSSSGDKEPKMSMNISDINFRPMGGNTSFDNPSEQSFLAGSHGTVHVTEVVWIQICSSAVWIYWKNYLLDIYSKQHVVPVIIGYCLGNIVKPMCHLVVVSRCSKVDVEKSSLVRNPW